MVTTNKSCASAFALLLALLLSGGCGAPASDGSTAEGKAAVKDAVNDALSVQDCTTALDLLKPVYDSPYTDNSIRMLQASADACTARINFFSTISNLSSNIGNLVAGSIWAVFPKLFPSVVDDRYVEAAGFGMDAVMSALKPGHIEVIPATQLICPAGTPIPGVTGVCKTSYNPGSDVVTDRVDDANLYLIFLAMAAIGGIESRFGAPDPVTFAPTTPLPWVTPDLVDANGCAYASAIINFVDALNAAGQVSASLKAMASAINTAIAGADGACNVGCTDVDVTVIPLYGGVRSGCTVTTDCTGCPLALRDRTQCKGLLSDQVSCAAAGIVNMINSWPTAKWSALVSP